MWCAFISFILYLIRLLSNLMLSFFLMNFSLILLNSHNSMLSFFLELNYIYSRKNIVEEDILSLFRNDTMKKYNVSLFIYFSF